MRYARKVWKKKEKVGMWKQCRQILLGNDKYEERKNVFDERVIKRKERIALGPVGEEQDSSC